jgi:hypothetical protein
MKSFKEFMDEDGAVAVAANMVGGGQIAGIGIGPNGEPGVNLKKKKKTPVLATLKRKAPL